MRRRNTVLQVLHLLKALEPRISVNEVIAFLYAAENEGLTVQDLACVAGMTQSTASRSLRALGSPGSPWSSAPAVGLLEAYLNPSDGRNHVIYLSARGREMRERIDALLLRGETIARDQAAPRGAGPATAARAWPGSAAASAGAC